MATRKKSEALEQASIPVERAGSNIIRIGDNEERVTATASYSTYTRMYKSHPIVRATIDKIAKSCVANGYQFVPRDPKADLDEGDDQTLREFFYRSRMSALLRMVYIDLLIYGDAYWWVQPTRINEPYAVMRVAPQQVSIVVEKETRLVTSYIVRDTQGQETQFPAEEFIHFRFYDPDNDVYGLSPLESLQSTVAQDLFAQTFNENFFANSAQTGIVFNMRGASKEEVERNREFLKKEYTAIQNAHKPVLLEGDVDVKPSVADHASMQFIDGRKQLTFEILAVFDMPYTKIGGSTESANRSQSAENDVSYRGETIAPLQNMVEDVINEDLLFTVLGIEDTLFAHKDVGPRDEEQQAKLNIELMNAGVYDLNFVRGKLGLKPVAGGDEPWVQTPLGLIPVSMVMEAAKIVMDNKANPGGAGGTVPEGAATPGGNLPNREPSEEQDDE